MLSNIGEIREDSLRILGYKLQQKVMTGDDWCCGVSMQQGVSDQSIYSQQKA